MAFDIRERLHERESVVFDDSSALPADPPAGGLTALSAAAEGGALWLLVAAAMALRPELRTTARNGALAVVVAGIGAHVLAAVVRRELHMSCDARIGAAGRGGESARRMGRVRGGFQGVGREARI